MILSTNNPSLLAACPVLRPHSVVYQHDLYGDSDRPAEISEWPHHNPPRATNWRNAAKHAVGRTLVDLERRGKSTPNADGVEVDNKGDWDFTTAGERSNPDQRWKDVYNMHRDGYLTLHHESPSVQVGWWLTPRDDYFSYRDYVLGDTTKADHYREVAAKLADEPQIMDFAAVVHYIHQDNIGESINGTPLTWQHRAGIIAAKVETANLFGVPVVVYVNPDGMPAVDVEKYLQQVAEHGGVDECVVWLPQQAEYKHDDAVVEGIKFFIHTRLS